MDFNATDHERNRGSFQRVRGAAVYGGVLGESAVGWGFWAFFALELSASFSSPRALTPVSARGLLPISFQLLSRSFMCGQTHTLTSFPKQRQQQHHHQQQQHNNTTTTTTTTTAQQQHNNHNNHTTTTIPQQQQHNNNTTTTTTTIIQSGEAPF